MCKLSHVGVKQNLPGFALPLKEEHKDFLIKALIPLHKAASHMDLKSNSGILGGTFHIRT